jgi:hypothetical protein
VPAFIGSVLAATLLRKNIRWIQRHADELGAQWISGRLVFDEARVLNYLERSLND